MTAWLMFFYISKKKKKVLSFLPFSRLWSAFKLISDFTKLYPVFAFQHKVITWANDWNAAPVMKEGHSLNNDIK